MLFRSLATWLRGKQAESEETIMPVQQDDITRIRNMVQVRAVLLPHEKPEVMYTIQELKLEVTTLNETHRKYTQKCVKSKMTDTTDTAIGGK